MVDDAQLNALRTLLDPEVVAAWLDEVDSYRHRPDQPVPFSPSWFREMKQRPLKSCSRRKKYASGWD